MTVEWTLTKHLASSDYKQAIDSLAGHGWHADTFLVAADGLRWSLVTRW